MPLSYLSPLASFEVKTTMGDSSRTKVFAAAAVELILNAYRQAGYDQEVEQALIELQDTGSTTLIHTAGRMEITLVPEEQVGTVVKTVNQTLKNDNREP